MNNKYSVNSNDLKYYHIFGIFLSLIGILLIMPKITTGIKKIYGEKFMKKKGIEKFMKTDKIENLFLLIGILFLIYGLKELFFKQMSDHEMLTAQLLFNLRETDVISADIYTKLSSFNNSSVLNLFSY